MNEREGGLKPCASWLLQLDSGPNHITVPGHRSWRYLREQRRRRPGRSASNPALLDQSESRPEIRVRRAAQPLEYHHFSTHEFRAGARQSVEGRIAIALGA